MNVVQMKYFRSLTRLPRECLRCVVNCLMILKKKCVEKLAITTK